MSVSRASTSSFVTEVLQNAGRLEKEDLHAKLGTLSKKTSELKTEIHDSLQKKYVDFYPNLMTAVDLSARVQTLSNEMETVASRVEKDIQTQLNISATEFQDLSSQLSESNAILHTLGRLVKISDSFQNFEASVEADNFREASGHLADVYTVLTTCAGPRDNKIKILEALREKYHKEHAKFVCDVTNSWVDMVKWDISKNDEKSKADATVRVSLCIAHRENHRQFAGNILQAMQDLDILSSKIQHFGDRFVKSVVESILTCADFHMDVNESEKSNVLTITGRHVKSTSEAIPPEKCFDNILVAIKFLNDNLFCTEVDIPKNGKSNVVPLLALLGSSIDKAVVDLIISDCLKHSVPSNSSELEQYREVISKTEGFQKVLQGIDFLKQEDSTLVDFVSDVDVLFANKKSQDILSKARDFMKSDIHSMVKIAPDPTDQLPAVKLEGRPDEASKEDPFRSATELSSDTFQLPTCYVSESAREIMNLASRTLHEAATSGGSDQCRILLFYCVRDVFMLYLDVVPTYHKKSLEDLPQVTALHHNNCMFLAHRLLLLGHQFRPKLPKPLCDGAATFVDLVPKLRHLGTEAFLRQMSKQRDAILNYLAAAQGFANITEGDSYRCTERAIKQMLHQIQHLSNIWHEVLPAPVYYKSIGTLLNSALVEIISRVTSLDDISADDCNQLQAVMKIITDRAPSFYEVKTNDTKLQHAKILLHTHIPKWNKFNELMWVLDAGLRDISDRWADGKGPLASDFQPNEVKQLIRAIFQNTDRRSKVLATIK